MTDPITNRVIQILKHSKHILIPLTELYDKLADEGQMAWINYDMFEYLISSDERFDILDGLTDVEFLAPELQNELRVRGILVGPLVMLTEQSATVEAVMLDILLYLQEMNQALEAAWQLRANDDAETEAELLHLLMMGDMLERELKSSLNVDPFSNTVEPETLEADEITKSN
jgi:hypothetical protein